MCRQCSDKGNCQFSGKVIWGKILKSSLAVLHTFIDGAGFLLRAGPQPCVMLRTMGNNKTSVSKSISESKNQGVWRLMELLRRGQECRAGGQRKKNVNIRHGSAHFHLGPSSCLGKRFLPDLLSRQEFLLRCGWPFCGGRKGNIGWNGEGTSNLLIMKQLWLRIDKTDFQVISASLCLAICIFPTSVSYPLLTLSGVWDLVFQAVMITYVLPKGWFFSGGDSHMRKLFHSCLGFAVAGKGHYLRTDRNNNNKSMLFCYWKMMLNFKIPLLLQ